MKPKRKNETVDLLKPILQEHHYDPAVPRRFRRTVLNGSFLVRCGRQLPRSASVISIVIARPAVTHEIRGPIRTVRLLYDLYRGE